MKMEQLLIDIKHIKMDEYNRARQQFGPTNIGGDHHSYGVIQEEMEEAQEEAARTQLALGSFWNSVKVDMPDANKMEYLAKLEWAAQLAAAKFIQVAAMAVKAQITIEERVKRNGVDRN